MENEEKIVDTLTLDFGRSSTTEFTYVTVDKAGVTIEQDDNSSVFLDANMANAIAEFILNAKIPIVTIGGDKK